MTTTWLKKIGLGADLCKRLGIFLALVIRGPLDFQLMTVYPEETLGGSKIFIYKLRGETRIVASQSSQYSVRSSYESKCWRMAEKNRVMDVVSRARIEA